MIQRPEWWDEANCRGVGTDSFFGPFQPDKETVAQRRKREAHAKNYCNNCPVDVECLSEALKFSDDGIRGGLTRYERQTTAPKVIEVGVWVLIGNSSGLTGLVTLEKRNGPRPKDPTQFRVVKANKVIARTNDESEGWIALYQADL
jgi:WhiB family redox-sensing transcriptional regulator